ncbi:MAG: hypothetical protein WBN42_10010 [Ignavibacteriaceae bacterium]
MYDLAIARILHIIGVVLWIGGVAFVTTVLLPTVRRFKAKEERIDFFEKVEHRFARQARLTTLLVGLTGFYMVIQYNMWERFIDLSYWWMHLMVLIWLIFTLLLFVLEPLFLHKRMRDNALRDPETTFKNIYKMHVILLLLSILTIIGAAAGSHGWLFF